MKLKIFASCLVLVMLVTPLAAFPAQPALSASVAQQVRSLGMFQTPKFNAHYRTPNVDQIESLIEQKGIPLPGPDAKNQAVQAFRQEWALRNPTTPNPEKLQALMDKERQGKLGLKPAAADDTQIMSLAIPVEFPTTPFTFTWCTEVISATGPLHNEIPAPGPRDNNTIWYDNTTPALYNELYFGVGPTAGVIVHHPNLGALDFRGSTMANYYLEQSEGTFQPHGEVFGDWLMAAYPEAWYGADSCDGTNHNVRAQDLVREVVDGVNADDPSFNWQAYDGDGNGIVDNFTVIHAGMGQEAGGGVQGSFAIWSHASAIDYPTGKLACTAGSTGCPDRNIYVREYSMDPENLDVGVISEEFGHAAFGLPDIYTTDDQASPANWAIMEAGSWNGLLGGMQPAPFPLYFRYLVGWAHPAELNYRIFPQEFTVGQLSQRPTGTEYGVKINLPDTVVTVPNLAGTGKAWWSDKADLADFTLAHDFDLTTATTPIFSFDTYWSFEAGYDYGYFEVSDNGGTTWTKLTDMDGLMVSDGMGNMGLNDVGSGNIRFDLSAYAGKSITLRLRDVSDVGVQWDGWWADNFLLKDGATTLFTDDVENPPNGWTTNHFVIVPLTRTFPMYYLAEWRNASGFDRGLATPYTTLYNNPATTEWQVDRCPYTVPGMLLWLRNGSQDWDYTLFNSIYDPPSWGPKHALLVIDSHFWPMEWNAKYAAGHHVRLNSRCQPGNATFTLQPTNGYTVRLAGDTSVGNIIETKTFTPLPAVSRFDDSMGYYPGFWYNLVDDSLYWWDKRASAVVPAKGDYTTNVTWLDKTPATDLYGIDVGGTILGTGNPGDNKVQYGVNLQVESQATDGSWGLIKVWNDSLPTLYFPVIAK